MSEHIIIIIFFLSVTDCHTTLLLLADQIFTWQIIMEFHAVEMVIHISKTCRMSLNHSFISPLRDHFLCACTSLLRVFAYLFFSFSLFSFIRITYDFYSVFSIYFFLLILLPILLAFTHRRVVFFAFYMCRIVGFGCSLFVLQCDVRCTI